MKIALIVLVILLEAKWIIEKIYYIRIFNALKGATSYEKQMIAYEKAHFTPEQQALLMRDRKIWEAKKYLKNLLKLFAGTFLKFSLGGVAIYLILICL